MKKIFRGGLFTFMMLMMVVLRVHAGEHNDEAGKGNTVKEPQLLEKGAHINVRDKLTAEEINFLTNQCHIDHADVDIIPQLNAQGREDLFSRIKKRDCELLAAFKASRNYYRQLSYDKPTPLAPAGWNIAYLTNEEFERYADIMDKAPW